MAAQHDEPTTAGPLDGIRVIELGSFIAGPFAGQLLGDYGAEVVKVEPPGTGDRMRHWGLEVGGEGLWWPTIGRNKRSVCIDLRRPEGAAQVRRLAREVDVIVENFRPGQMESWGLDYETLSSENPGLVLVHVSGFGRTGPRANEAGFGSVGEAMGGMRHTTGEPDRPPARTGISLGDSLASLFAVIGALAALTERQTSGRGQEVDVAIYEAVAALMESTLAESELAGVTRGRTGGTLPGVAPSGVYPTADGGEVLIAGNADTVFARLCTAMGRPDLVGDEHFATHQARGSHAAELDELIAAWSRGIGTDQLVALLADHGVPSSRIYTARDMLVDPHYLARDMVVRAVDHLERVVPMTGVVPRFSRTPGSIRWPGQPLGADTDAVVGASEGA